MNRKLEIFKIVKDEMEFDVSRSYVTCIKPDPRYDFNTVVVGEDYSKMYYTQIDLPIYQYVDKGYDRFIAFDPEVLQLLYDQVQDKIKKDIVDLTSKNSYLESRATMAESQWNTYKKWYEAANTERNWLRDIDRKVQAFKKKGLFARVIAAIKRDI